MLSPASEALGKTSSSFAGAVQVLLDLIFRAADRARPQLAAIDTTRVLSAAVVVLLLGWLVLRERTASDPWAAVASIVGASFLATPWYLPWYSVGPLALGLCIGGGAAAGSLMLSTTSSAAIPLLAGGAMLRFVPPAFGWGVATCFADDGTSVGGIAVRPSSATPPAAIALCRT